MKSLFLVCSVLTLLYSCNNNKINKSGVKDTDRETAPVQDTLDVMDSLNAPDSSMATLPSESVISETVSAGNLPVQVYKTISSNSQSLRILLTDVEPGTLKINLTHSDEYANIRISQVIMPDGSSDGPFGRDLKLNARQKGDYTIIINKSNMASGSQVGDVVITIEK